MLGAASAQGVTFEVAVVTDVFGVQDSDFQGPASAGSLLAEIEPGGEDFDGGPAYGRAAVNDEGVNAVAVEGFYANGQPGPYTLNAGMMWMDSDAPGLLAPERYALSFSLAPIQLAFEDFNPGAPPDMMEAAYNIQLTVDGFNIFGSQAVMRGDQDFGVTLSEDGVDLGGTFFEDGSFIGYDFDAFSTTFDLGVRNPGETVVVELVIAVGVSTPGFETGARALSGDPLDLGGTNVNSIALIPEPATALLLAGGLGALAATRRRRARR